MFNLLFSVLDSSTRTRFIFPASLMDENKRMTENSFLDSTAHTTQHEHSRKTNGKFLHLRENSLFQLFFSLSLPCFIFTSFHISLYNSVRGDYYDDELWGYLHFVSCLLMAFLMFARLITFNSVIVRWFLRADWLALPTLTKIKLRRDRGSKTFD